MFFFFSSRRRHTRWTGDWSSDVCSSDLVGQDGQGEAPAGDQQERRLLAVGRAAVGDDAGAFHIAQKPGEAHLPVRSEERRVGKECRWRWSAGHLKKRMCSSISSKIMRKC